MAKFKVGDKVVWTAFGGKPMEVIDMNDKGEYLCRDKDGNEVVFSEEKLKLANARNASSSPFGFFVGEQVVIKKDPSNKKYRVKEITETGDIRLEGATPLFDASELDTANYAGPYRATNAKFKAGDKAYVHWFSGEDELVDVISYEPKGDYYIVRGEDGQLAHPKASLLYPVKNASALNAARVGMKDTNGRDISIGDSIQHIDSKMKGKVVGKFNEHLLLVDWDGGFQEEVHPSDIRITNSRAANAKFKAGDKVYFYGRPATVKQVIREPDADYILDVQGSDFYAEDEEVTSRNSRACNSTNAIVRKALNSTALNFSPGDKVSIVDTDIRYGGDKGEVVRKDGFRYVVRLTSRLDKPEVLLQPNQLKAANSEDALGHEHGSDGKFASKGGGSDGGDSYEDPKTKRMKERLAKMREKNEALRKDIEARKAGLAQKKADTEKMRTEVMKANVEKWKAAQKSKNAVVQNALNAATARNFTPTSEFEVGDKVRFRDCVRSVPHDETYTVVKVSGKDVTIKGGRDGGTSVEFANNLEPVFNAATARNAEDDWVERFEVGGVYHGPYMNKDWLAKVLSRTDSSIRVAIKSRRDKTWHGKDEQVTLRINKRQAEEDGTEVAKGYGWEFWANDFE